MRIQAFQRVCEEKHSYLLRRKTHMESMNSNILNPKFGTKAKEKNVEKMKGTHDNG